ncbi:MAG: hypothetical protein AAFV71_29385 [Cyanobacteria bacterium J06633_8]
MNKLNKFSFISYCFYIAVCINICSLIDNSTASGQTPSFSNKQSSIVNFISFNNSSSPGNNSVSSSPGNNSVSSSPGNNSVSSSPGNNSVKDADNDLIKNIATLIAFVPSVGIIAFQKVQFDRLKGKHEDEIVKIKKDLEEKYNHEDYNKQFNRDFLALVYEEVSLRDMIVESDIFKKGNSEKEKEIELQEEANNFELSREAVNGLLDSYFDKKENQEKKILKAIVHDVIDNNFPGISDADFEDKCMHLYIYLKGWLICSLRYKTTQFSTEQIKNDALNYSDKIIVLEDTKKFILNEKIVSDCIPKEKSRQLICDYIDILIGKV